MIYVRAVLSTTLLVSAMIGAQIVLTDRFLFYAAPSHAEGLAVFVALDVLSAIMLWKRLWLGSLLAMVLALTQALAMLGDVFTYMPAYFPHQAFRIYLLNDIQFTILLSLQPVILMLSLGSIILRYDINMIRRWAQAKLPHWH